MTQMQVSLADRVARRLFRLLGSLPPAVQRSLGGTPVRIDGQQLHPTAQLGLRGFRLNLAVEAAEGYEGLLELMPKIREAIGDARVKPLQRALQGHS